MSFLCSRHTTDINFLNIPTSCKWQMIFFTSRQRLNASCWCLQWTLPFAGPQSNLHIPRADPRSKKHISHFTLCCSGGERQRSFFPFLLDWCIHSLGSELEIQNQKMHRKKWQHIAIFCFTGLVSCVKGEGTTGRIASIGSIYLSRIRKELSGFAFQDPRSTSRQYFFLSFFTKLAVQENRQKKKKKRRSSSDSSFAQHKKSNLRPLTCSSKPKQPRPLADQTFTDKTITRKQRSRGSSE